MRNMVPMSRDLVALGITHLCPSTQKALESGVRMLNSFSKYQRWASVKLTQGTSVATQIQSRLTRVICKPSRTPTSKLRPIHRLLANLPIKTLRMLTFSYPQTILRSTLKTWKHFRKPLRLPISRASRTAAAWATARKTTRALRKTPSLGRWTTPMLTSRIWSRN